MYIFKTLVSIVGLCLGFMFALHLAETVQCLLSFYSPQQPANVSLFISLCFQVALSWPIPRPLFFSDILCQAAKVESVVAQGGPSRFR